MSCRGLCKKHPQYVPLKKIDYSTGMKVCFTCDRVIFVNFPDSHCPCCNRALRTRPQYYGEKSKLTKEMALHRH